MTIKIASEVRATSWSADCPCGGAVMNIQSGSFLLDGDAKLSDGRRGGICEDCEAEVLITRKTAVLS